MQNIFDLIKVMNENIQAAEYENEYLINHIYKEAYSKKVTLLDMSDYTSNPYAMKVTPKEAKVGSLTLFYDHYEKHQMFLADEIKIGENFREEAQIGHFDMPYDFLALKKDDKIWMSITPHEMNTMAEPIRRAKGRVLVLGLGLGYYPFMVSNKDEVTEVTVVENDPEVISLFKKHLLPYFPNGKKIKILKGDGLNITRRQKINDFIFADLWHQPREALPMYLTLKHREDPEKEYCYWIEKSILALIRRCVLIVFEEMAYGAGPEDFLEEENEDDHLINAVYDALSRRRFRITLDDETLAKFAKRIHL